MYDLILQGKWFMAPLLLCSIVGLAIIVERWLYLRNAWRESDSMLVEIDQLAADSNVDGIEAYCNENHGLLSNIFSEGVRKYKQLRDEPNLDFIQHEITKVMEDASFINSTDLERRLPVLASVGNVSPLFGFAGTVTGMISAFAAIAEADNPSARVVASGIKEALVTTATGLLIAIPAVLFHNYFTNQIDALNARVEESANGVIDMLVMSLVSKRKTNNADNSELSEQSTAATGGGE